MSFDLFRLLIRFRRRCGVGCGTGKEVAHHPTPLIGNTAAGGNNQGNTKPARAAATARGRFCEPRAVAEKAKSAQWRHPSQTKSSVSREFDVASYHLCWCGRQTCARFGGFRVLAPSGEMGAVSRVSQLALRMHTARAVFRSAVRDANHPTSVFARKIRVFANSSGRHGEAAPARGSWRNETVPRSFRTCTALYEKSTGTTTAGNEIAHTLNDTADASSQKIIRHNSVGDADSATVAAADAALQSKRDVADTLKILKVVKAVRTRGHLSARLDPLGRSLGPLIEGARVFVFPASSRLAFWSPLIRD